MNKLDGLRDELILKKEEEALLHFMKKHASKQCPKEQKAYAECVKGRTISLAWACRDVADTMNSCLQCASPPPAPCAADSKFTDERAREALRAKWVAAGRPNLLENPPGLI